MRSVSIPPPVRVIRKMQDKSTIEEDITFFRWMEEFVLPNVKAFRIGTKGTRRAIKVSDALEDIEKKGLTNVLTLEDADWESIKDTITEGEWAYPNSERLLPFMDAIEKAPEVK